MVLSFCKGLRGCGRATTLRSSQRSSGGVLEPMFRPAKLLSTGLRIHTGHPPYHSSMQLHSKPQARWSDMYPGYAGNTAEEPTEVELIFQEWLQKEQDYLIVEDDSDSGVDIATVVSQTIDWDDYASVPFIPDIPLPTPSVAPEFPLAAAAASLAGSGHTVMTTLSSTSSTTLQENNPRLGVHMQSLQSTSGSHPKDAATNSMQQPSASLGTPPASTTSRRNAVTSNPRYTAASLWKRATTASSTQTDAAGESQGVASGGRYVTDESYNSAVQRQNGVSGGRYVATTEQMMTEEEKLFIGLDSGDEEAVLLRVQRWAERDDLAQRQRELLSKLARKLQRSGMRKGKFEVEPYATQVRDPLQFLKPAIVVLMIPFVALMFAMLNGFQGAPL